MICGADFVVRGRGWTGDDDRGSVPPPGGLPKLLKNQFALIRDHGIGALAAKIEGRMNPVVPLPIPESRIGPLLNDAEYVRVCREAKVAIGVNRVTNATHPPRRPLVYSRLRDVEAPMLGACYLTERAPGLETMYQLGAEIEIYSTAEELAEKLGALLGDSARRKRMRKLAQRRALEEHCVGRTIARIAAHFGL